MIINKLYARAVAVAIEFPEKIEVQIQPVDLQGNGLGYHFKQGPETWQEVKHRFWIDVNYGKECEGYFAEGDAALIAGPQHMDGEWDIPTGRSHY